MVPAKQKEKPKKDVEVIDSQIVLRIFLEYYLREKKVRALILKRLFDEEPRLGTSNKAGISFTSFRKVMEQFDPDIADIDVATLYRDAWTAGVGNVNFESFFLVANEGSFFLKTMRFTGFNPKPQIDNFEEFNPESKYEQKLDAVYKVFKKQENMITECKKQVDMMGNEICSQKLARMEQYIKNKSQTDMAVFRGRDLIQIMRRLHLSIMFFRASYMEVY